MGLALLVWPALAGDYTLNRGICIGTAAECPTPREPARDGAAGAEVAALPAVAPPDRQTREDLLWESAQHSNLRADYQVYLDAFPNGVFAQMAKNRIASLEEPGVARSGTDWKSETGTAETEKALNLTPAEQKEIQQRLTALDLYKGPATGAFNPPTRSAITEWQKSRGVALSSFLGPMQLAELREESEDAYQTLLAAQLGIGRRLRHQWPREHQGQVPNTTASKDGSLLGMLLQIGRGEKTRRALPHPAGCVRC